MNQFPECINFVRVYVDINDWSSDSVYYVKDASVYSRLSKLDDLMDKGKASYNFSTENFFYNLDKLCEQYPDSYFPLSVGALLFRTLFDPEMPRLHFAEKAVIKVFQNHGYEFKQEPYYGTIKRIGIGDRILKDI